MYCIFSTEMTVHYLVVKCFSLIERRRCCKLRQFGRVVLGMAGMSLPLREKHQGFAAPLVSSYTTKSYLEALSPPWCRALPAMGVTGLWEAIHRTLLC